MPFGQLRICYDLRGNTLATSVAVGESDHPCWDRLQKNTGYVGYFHPPGPRTGLSERQAPGKVVTAGPPKRWALLRSVSHALVSTLQKHRSKMSKLIWFGSLHFRDNWRWPCTAVPMSLICSNTQWWDCSSLMSAPLPAEAGCETCSRIVLLLVFVA